jgi:hypothetical protein
MMNKRKSSLDGSESNGGMTTTIGAVIDRNGKSSIVKRSREALLVPWMPCSILGGSIYLGSLEQVRNPIVIRGLGITHVVSIGRYNKTRSLKNNK